MPRDYGKKLFLHSQMRTVNIKQLRVQQWGSGDSGECHGKIV